MANKIMHMASPCPLPYLAETDNRNCLRTEQSSFRLMWPLPCMGPEWTWINSVGDPHASSNPELPHLLIPTMAHQPADVPRAPSGKNTTTPSLEQVLEILSGVIPHMSTDSQASFISMFRDSTTNLPSHKTPKSFSQRTRLPLLPGPLHNYVRGKTYACVSNIHIYIGLLISLQNPAFIRI